MAGLRLIVGLGNPGAEYARTRHNAGAWFLDALAERHGVRLGRDARLQAELGKAVIAGQPVWLARPTTFMNHSGRALVALLNYYKIPPEQALVAHDELDLPAGTVRLKFDGGHGGQNGLRDILGQLGHGRFHRLRVGIGHPGHKDKVTPWVLGRPGADDEAAIRGAIEEAVQATPVLVEGGFERAMKDLHTSRT
ncbi:MAG: aminoacyl-tRNA hydrolase [Pseudoxanthomonas sp.]|nr:aminoacyl-tRNA hydrolase [Pseudoxanthomonas sp.]